MTTRTDVASATSAAEGAPEEAFVAVRNALKLGGSLLLTWGIALGARILLPRYLGPEQFGALNFAETFTTAVFSLMALGADVYVRKEVSVRPGHASDFFGGLLLVRLLILGVLTLLLGWVLPKTGTNLETEHLVLVFAGWQALVITGNTLSAILHAATRVNGLSVVNVVAKVLWGAGLVVAIVAGFGLLGIVGAFLVSEAVKVAALWFLARREAGLRFRVNLAAVGAMLLASLPFYLNQVAVTAYGRIDVSILSFSLHDAREVGWYGAASTLSAMGLMLTPLMAWVLMPLFSRALARSEDEFFTTLRRAIEFSLVLGIPVTLALAVGAELWIALLFGGDYAPAALGFRLLAPTFVLSYITTLCSQALVILDRGWRVTALSVCGLLLNGLLNVLWVGPMHRTFGMGGGGAGAGLAVLVSESFVAVVLLAWIGRRIFERGAVLVVLRNVAACVVSVLAFILLSRALGHARIAVAAVVYLVCAFLFRAVPLQELLAFGRAALRRRHEPA